jgi:enterochelin esterase-like enzyme
MVAGVTALAVIILLLAGVFRYSDKPVPAVPADSARDNPAAPVDSKPENIPEDNQAASEAAPETPEDEEDAPLWVTPAVKSPRVEHRVFDSASTGTKVSYHIYTPVIYDKEKDRRFPVLYWLHGSGGGLEGIPYLARYFDTAIRTGRTLPMIVVFPNGLPHGMWCDSKDGKTPVETIFIKELIPHIDASFRTIASREGRILDGFSMGGYGAARLGFKHHKLFCGISILGGGPLQQRLLRTPRTGPRNREKILRAVYGGDQDYFVAQSPWVLAEKNADALRKSMLIRQAIGDRDETLRNNRKFHARLTKLEIPHTYTELPGVGHQPMRVLGSLGKTNWEFYRAAFSAKSEGVKGLPGK